MKFITYKSKDNEKNRFGYISDNIIIDIAQAGKWQNESKGIQK